MEKRKTKNYVKQTERRKIRKTNIKTNQTNKQINPSNLRDRNNLQ